MFLFLFMGLFFSNAIFANQKSSALKRNDLHDPQHHKEKLYTKKECPELTKSCRVCPDLTLIGDDLKPMKNQDPLSCLRREAPQSLRKTKGVSELVFSELKKVNCRVISPICALCPDQSFISVDSGRKLATDLYECVNGPRTKQEVGAL